MGTFWLSGQLITTNILIGALTDTNILLYQPKKIHYQEKIHKWEVTGLQVREMFTK